MQDPNFGDNLPKDWQKAKTNTRRVAKRAGISILLKASVELLTKLVQDSVAKALQTQAGNGKGNGRGNGRGNGKGNGRVNGKGNGRDNGKGNDKGKGRVNGKGNGKGNGHGNGNCRNDDKKRAARVLKLAMQMCDGEVHKAPESECWKNPANDDKKRAARVLKLAMQMCDGAGVNKNEASVDSGVNESDLYVSLFPHSHTLPSTCTVLSAAHVQIAPALPDTQAGITVTNNRSHVTKMHNETRTLHGIVGSASVVAHLADLAVPLQTKQGNLYNLVVRRSQRCPGGLYSPDASSIVLAHEDLKAAGMRVDYDAGRISLPNEDTISMHKVKRTWRIDLAPPAAQVNISKDQHPHVALQDAIWMGLSSSSLLKVYNHYNGAGFGNATKAEIRHFENPVTQLYRGKATYVKSPRMKAQALQKSSIPRVRILPGQAMTAFFDPADPPSVLQHGGPKLRQDFTKGTSSQGEPTVAILRPTSGSGEHTADVQTAPILRNCSDQNHSACMTYSDRFQSAAGTNNRQYLKGQLWHMDWGDLGHNTVGIKGTWIPTTSFWTCAPARRTK